MSSSQGVLIVTGGSRGIGAAISRLAALRGYSVAINFHSDKLSADKLVEEIERKEGRATAIQADIGDERDILRLFETSDKTLGPLSALVNNAAITGGFSRVDSVNVEMLNRLMAVKHYGCHTLFSRGRPPPFHKTRWKWRRYC